MRLTLLPASSKEARVDADELSEQRRREASSGTCKVEGSDQATQNGSRQISNQVTHRVGQPRFLHRQAEHLVHGEFEELPHHAERDGDADRNEGQRPDRSGEAIAFEEHQDEQKPSHAEPCSGHAMQREVPPPDAFVHIESFAQQQRRRQEDRQCNDEGQRQNDVEPGSQDDGHDREDERQDSHTRQRRAIQKSRGQREAGERGPDQSDHPSAQPRAEPAGLVRVASYNIRKAIGLDWRRDPARILRVADATRADILALQEADKRFGVRPPAIPRDLFAASRWRPVPLGLGDSLGSHGNAILLGPDAKLLWSKGIDLPGLEPRGAALAQVELRGCQILLAAVHLGLLRRHRRVQLTVLADRLREYQGTAAIAGDFNEWSDAVGLEALMPEFDVHVPGRSFHAARPVAGLDRIALRHGTRLHGGGVLETPEARRASDHLPIWVDLAL
ncbi:MAG: endonuclease/exonuclease/phosphatase family protein [Pseudomonadota bacterium]